MTEDWDERERSTEKKYQDLDLDKKVELLELYIPLVKEYAQLNNIEIPPDCDDDYLKVIYGFVWDAKFIDFAFDKSGIIFNEQMYTLPFTEEDIDYLKSDMDFISEEDKKTDRHTNHEN